MSMGLVAYANNRLHMVVESKGLFESGLESKVKRIQERPLMMIVFTGYLDYWRYTFDQYTPCKSFQDAAEQIAGHIHAFSNQTPPHWDVAFCRLCGYENGQPVVYKVDWVRGKDAAIEEVDLIEGLVVPIGCVSHAIPGAEMATGLLRQGMSPEAALRQSIEEEILRANPAILEGPVHYAVI